MSGMTKDPLEFEGKQASPESLYFFREIDWAGLDKHKKKRLQIREMALYPGQDVIVYGTFEKDIHASSSDFPEFNAKPVEAKIVPLRISFSQSSTHFVQR